MYTRRMSRTELDIWLELKGDVSPLERDLAERFIQLEDSMFFLSSIRDEIVGGTAIYRDRNRLAVALLAIHHSTELKEAAQIQLLKSSLPFFRSVTIHHVDAIVGSSGKSNTLPFPAGFVLDHRFEPLLENLGFASEEIILQCTIEITGSERPSSSDTAWNITDDQNDVRDLFWRQNKTTGVDSSLVTLGWQMAHAKKLLQTLEDDKGITAAVGVESLENTSMIWPVIADFRLIDEETLARAIQERVLRTSAQELVLPILGTGQREFAEKLADLCNGRLTVEEASLLRKQL